MRLVHADARQAMQFIITCHFVVGMGVSAAQFVASPYLVVRGPSASLWRFKRAFIIGLFGVVHWEG